MKKQEKVFKYLLKKRVAVNISFIVKGKKPELAEREVDSFVKKTITNFVIHLQEDKIIKSFDPSTKQFKFSILSRCTTETVPPDEYHIITWSNDF